MQAVINVVVGTVINAIAGVVASVIVSVIASHLFQPNFPYIMKIVRTTFSSLTPSSDSASRNAIPSTRTIELRARFFLIAPFLVYLACLRSWVHRMARKYDVASRVYSHCENYVGRIVHGRVFDKVVECCNYSI